MVYLFFGKKANSASKTCFHANKQYLRSIVNTHHKMILC